MARWYLRTDSAFALPTVLISSVVMLMLLVTAISATVAVRNGLQDQRYTELASAAAEAGTVMATSCLNQNGGQAAWTDDQPLKPNTDCAGNVISGRSAYVLEQADVRTYFTVLKPLIGAGNVPVSAAVKGYSEVLRSSSGVAWRVWSSDTAVALSTATDGLPVGSYIDGAWTSAPAGYLLADGSAVSRTTYANLFAVIGTTYGTGDGSTTFNLPDTRGRVPVHRSGDTEFDVLGEKYGEKSHTQTESEMPSHHHLVFAQVNNGNWALSASTYAGYARSNADTWNYGIDNGGTNVVATVGRTSGSGGGQAFNVVQPSVVVNRAIRY